MQKYLVKLNDGSSIELTGQIDSAEFTKTLNSNQVSFVDIGGYILQKHTIMMIVPVKDDPTPTEAK